MKEKSQAIPNLVKYDIDTTFQEIDKTKVSKNRIILRNEHP